MATEEEPQDAAPKKRSKMPMILGLVLFLVLGGAGFFAVYSGMILGHEDPAAAAAEAAPLPEVAFVPVEPLTVTVGSGGQERHLRFVSQIEVEKAYADEVTHLLPRILDVLNGYLRAVDTAELEDPSALVRVRAQILRRIQVVTGEGRVRDLLITEYILK